jgi:riboflavin kinase/FMN adenylyltransferase
LSTVTATKNIDAIAIGGFDGMHIGHQHLFANLGNRGAIVVIETGYANLTPGREREHFSEHPIFYYPLESIRHLDGKGFLGKLLDDFPALKKIVVGYDFHFGKDRGCSHKDLKTIFSGEVVVIDEVCLHDDSVHSHKIRAKLSIGDIEGANAFLGHNYTVHGTVIKGQGLGAKSLVPTINLDVKTFLLPKEGVYATLTRINDEAHFRPSVSFIGHRITTDGSYAVETHLLDGPIHDVKHASISFTHFIRENQKFESLEALKAAINADIFNAKRVAAYLEL